MKLRNFMITIFMSMVAEIVISAPTLSLKCSVDSIKSGPTIIKVKANEGAYYVQPYTNYSLVVYYCHGSCMAYHIPYNPPAFKQNYYRLPYSNSSEVYSAIIKAFKQQNNKST